jgi:hypothetical protein
MMAPMSRTKGRRAAKRQRQCSTSASFHDPFATSAGQGKRSFTEVEKGIALEELRHMRTLAAAVREL